MRYVWHNGREIAEETEIRRFERDLRGDADKCQIISYTYSQSYLADIYIYVYNFIKIKIDNVCGYYTLFYILFYIFYIFMSLHTNYLIFLNF